jgi:two-component system, chemotaxis family, response regulator Rcp1
MNAKRCFKIILAEDNPADTDLVRRALREHGIDCDLHVIGDGAQVIEQICRLDRETESPAFDLLILDMHLPKENGETVLRCLRGTAHYRQTPVVVMAREDVKLIADQAAASPALFFFEKPSSFDEFMRLGALVRSILVVAKKPESRSGPHDNRSAGAA